MRAPGEPLGTVGGWSLRRHPDGGVLICAGELDVGSEEPLRRELAAALAGTQERLLVDVSGVTFMDCAALSALVSARELAQAENIRVTLLGSNRPVRRLLQLTCTTDLFIPQQRRPSD